jgi:hypothetical protein
MEGQGALHWLMERRSLTSALSHLMEGHRPLHVLIGGSSQTLTCAEGMEGDKIDKIEDH